MWKSHFSTHIFICDFCFSLHYTEREWEICHRTCGTLASGVPCHRFMPIFCVRFLHHVKFMYAMCALHATWCCVCTRIFILLFAQINSLSLSHFWQSYYLYVFFFSPHLRFRVCFVVVHTFRKCREFFFYAFLGVRIIRREYTKWEEKKIGNRIGTVKQFCGILCVINKLCCCCCCCCVLMHFLCIHNSLVRKGHSFLFEKTFARPMCPNVAFICELKCNENKYEERERTMKKKKKEN